MKALEIIAGILAGAVFVTFIIYLAARILKTGREEAERNRRIYDDYCNRHISPKP